MSEYTAANEHPDRFELNSAFNFCGHGVQFDVEYSSSLPSQKKKREIVLEKLVEVFDFDRTYSEREVNQIIMEFYDDFCILRCEMIGFGLMTRDHEVYRQVRKE